jgi:hypothetical protein
MKSQFDLGKFNKNPNIPSNYGKSISWKMIDASKLERERILGT